MDTDGTFLYFQVNFNGYTQTTMDGAFVAHVSVTDNGSGVEDIALPKSTGNVCPLTQGFWKNHESAWPVTSLNLGGVVYTEAQLLVILETPVAGDASLILAHQLIAALLNIANGSNITPILGALADAQSELAAVGPLPAGVDVSSAAGQAMVATASILDSYNSGLLTPGCI